VVAQKPMQKEMQERMGRTQMIAQARGGERMRRLQLSMQMAFVREQLYWFGGVYSLGLLGVTAQVIKTKSIPKVAAIPLVVAGTFIAYQWDFAYGNKIDRINKIHHDILREEKHWFVPLLIPINEMKLDPELYGGLEFEEEEPKKITEGKQK